jgi:hypothetical protein
VSSPAVDVQQYWPFVILCALLLVSLVRLLLRERVALQTSISFLTFLGLFTVAAIIPNQAARLAHAMGFTLLSNFLFCAAIIALVLLHLRALIALSRLEVRTIQLIQDLAILQERLARQTETNAVRTERDR